MPISSFWRHARGTPLPKTIHDAQLSDVPAHGTYPRERGKKEKNVNIYEAIGVAYTILATAVFSVEVIYFCVRELGNLRRLIARGQAEESLDLERSESIKKKLAKVPSDLLMSRNSG